MAHSVTVKFFLVARTFVYDLIITIYSNL